MNKNIDWGYLLHLGFNMWTEHEEKDGIHCHPTRSGYQCATDYLRFDRAVWNDTIDALKNIGCNMLIIDLGEGVKLESHPEIAVEGSLSKKEFCDEVSRLTDMGFKVIPKYNFSTGHNVWMGPYARMVSTPQYYSFCDDIIDEAKEMFPNAELFHLGMDEEVMSVVELHNISIIRQGELYWHDQNKLFSRVEKNGMRPWIWADYVWHTAERRDAFLANMTKDVLLSNWYYHDFKEDSGIWQRCYQGFELLEKHGFDQFPTASNHAFDENMDLLVDHCNKKIAPERLKGYMMTTWAATVEEKREKHFEGIKIMGDVLKKYNDGGYDK